jgi:hypothetical protein
MFIIWIFLLFIIGCILFYFNIYSPQHGGSVQLREDFMSHRRPTSYIFWNGQFPSTFRVLQSIYDENRNVVPIYVDSGSMRDANQMRQIRATSKKIYGDDDPLLRERLRPLLVIPSNSDDHPTSQRLLNTARDLGHPVELPLADEPALHPEYTDKTYPNISYSCNKLSRRDMLHKAQNGGYAKYLQYRLH